MANSGNAKSYSFKSVGNDIIEELEAQSYYEQIDLPIGIKTPLEITDDHTGIFKMHTTLGAQLKDNFKNLILTNHGERLGVPEYGANLASLTLELGSEAGDLKAMGRIRTAVEKFMPYVVLENFEPFKVQAVTAAVVVAGVRVIYSIPSAGITRTALEVLLTGQE